MFAIAFHEVSMVHVRLMFVRRPYFLTHYESYSIHYFELPPTSHPCAATMEYP